MTPKRTSVKTSAEVMTRGTVPQAHGGALLPGGTGAGGRPPNAFREECRRALEDADALGRIKAMIENASTRDRDRLTAMEMLMDRAYGKPMQAVEVKDVTPDAVLTGEQIAERVWQRLEQLAQVAPQDRRLQVVASIKGAEEILNAFEDTPGDDA